MAAAAALPLQLGLFVREFVVGGDRVVGAVFQERDDGDDLVEAMKDIAAARHAELGTLLAGANARAEIGDGGVGSEAAVLAFEQAEGPGIAVTLIFGTK